MAADNYTWSLSEANLKKAIEELNEDPKERLGAVETFRQWVIQQPHLNCPTDTKFMLRLLRRAHFSQLEAREVLEKYLRNKTKFPKWLDNMDPVEKELNTFLKTGYLLPLPGVNDEGRKVILVQVGKIDPDCKDYDRNTAMKTYFTYLNYHLDDENLQVCGFEYFMDLAGFTYSRSSYLTMEDKKRLVTIWAGGIPARVKQFHLYNGGPVFDSVITVLKTVMAKKMIDRIKFHGSNLENVYKYIPMRILPNEYLPDDYKGPSAGPVHKILENLLIDLESDNVRERLMAESKPEYGVDESRRPRETQAASFRRLNSD